MKPKDLEIFNALRFDEIGKYWYYHVSTSKRRSGQMRVSNKKYAELKKEYNNESAKESGCLQQKI